MTQVTSSASTEPRVLIDQLYEYVNSAYDVLESGDYVALTDLNDWMKELCDCIGKLPVAEAQLYMQELTDLMEALDDLKAVMETHKSRLNDQMNGLEQSKKAAKAYQKSSHMGNKKEE